MRRAWFLSLLAIVPAYGQLGSNTLTISATRSTYLQPDQVVFSLSVSSPVSTSLDQVVAALSGLGITVRESFGRRQQRYPANSAMEFHASRAYLQPDGNYRRDHETGADLRSKQQRPDVKLQRERNASIATVTGIAILLKLRSDRGRNSSGAEAGRRGRNDAGAGPRLVQRTLESNFWRSELLRSSGDLC